MSGRKSKNLLTASLYESSDKVMKTKKRQRSETRSNEDVGETTRLAKEQKRDKQEVVTRKVILKDKTKSNEVKKKNENGNNTLVTRSGLNLYDTQIQDLVLNKVQTDKAKRKSRKVNGTQAAQSHKAGIEQIDETISQINEDNEFLLQNAMSPDGIEIEVEGSDIEELDYIDDVEDVEQSEPIQGKDEMFSEVDSEVGFRRTREAAEAKEADELHGGDK